MYSTNRYFCISQLTTIQNEDFVMGIQQKVLELDSKLSGFISKKTKNFIQTKIGKCFLLVIFVGPITFIPTLWEAYVAPNIDALRTPTWPLMILVNISVYVSLSHNGDWRTRTVMLLWIIIMALIWLATIIR